MTFKLSKAQLGLLLSPLMNEVSKLNEGGTAVVAAQNSTPTTDDKTTPTVSDATGVNQDAGTVTQLTGITDYKPQENTSQLGIQGKDYGKTRW